MMIKIRDASQSDRETVFKWRNDDLTRRMARVSEPVTWEGHCCWFASVMEDPARTLMMCYTDQIPSLAVLRFDCAGEQAEVSLNLAPEKRGKGYAPKCLLAGINSFAQANPKIGILYAEIKTSNIASLKSFEKAGFSIEDEKEGFWHLSVSIDGERA